ncbi:sugar-binding domain-containing protein [Reichenbachiella versicolor]|uniref:sugar-binding domain-containing protein n=1 Tax=Reichenbachiella versicolor TaxID=1821036 RepID=UPI000D6E88DD|nr:sugar-binding domain-containing protein [Reichenbachiella versicolor]
MIQFKKISPLLIASLLVVHLGYCQNEIINFNKDWNFILDEYKEFSELDYQNPNWEKLNVPHDWSVSLPFDSAGGEGCTGYLPGGIGWYTKEFELDTKADQKVYLYFDGVYNHSEYWLNGQKIGNHVYGYTPHFFNITPYLKNNNQLVVKVDRTRIADSRWYTGSGIYRDVKLIVQSDLSIPIWATFVTTPSVSKDKAAINIDYQISNDNKKTRNLEVEYKIIDSSNKIVQSASEKLKAKSGTSSFGHQLSLTNPKLWGVDEPNLYTARVTIKEKGIVKHIENTRFGIRSIRFDVNKGFFLNDENMKIKGVCIHHDGGAVGAAVPKEVWRRRLELLKEMGCNAIRMAHNPSSDELLDLCDEMGFLVQDEFFDEWQYPKDKRQNKWDRHDDYESRGYGDYFNELAETDLKHTVLAHRNHPSIFQWSIGNEIEWTFPSNRPASGFFDNIDWTGAYFWSPTPFSRERIRAEYAKHSVNEIKVRDVAKNLEDWTKTYDTTRPIIANCILPSVSLENGYADALDIVGFSYRRVMYDYAHKLYPNKVIMGTENLPQWHEWKAIMERDFVSGTFLWTGFDHMGEVNGRWPSKSSPVGLMDQAGFPKQGYHMYRSLWSDEPYLNISTQHKDSIYYLEKQVGLVKDKRPEAWDKRYWYRNARNEHWNYSQDEEVYVEIISNCPEVELFLNGKSLGKKTLDQFPDRTYKWYVPFQEGTISAVGMKDGQKVSYQITSSGTPAGIQATIDKSSLKDGEVAHLIIQLLDANGNAVRHSNKRIEFELPKGLSNLGVDNGHYRSTQTYSASSVVTDKGRALMVIRAEDLKGDAEIKVKGNGLKTASVKISVK